MTWDEALREAASNPQGRLSSSRLIAVVAGFTLSFCTLALTPLAYMNAELVTPLTVSITALAGLAGSGYVTNRITATKGKIDAD